MMRLFVALSFCLVASAAGPLTAEDDSAPKTAMAAVSRLPGSLPDKVIDRMKVPVTAKFTLPLERAFEEIFKAIDVKCVVDGVALKSSGITKNEVQKLSLENRPLYEVIQAILKRRDRLQTYPDIVFCIDEEKKTVTITTRESAEAKKLETVDFEQFEPKEKKPTNVDRS